MFRDPLDELVDTLQRARRNSDRIRMIRDAIDRHWFDGDKAKFEEKALHKLNEELIETIKRILRE